MEKQFEQRRYENFDGIRAIAAIGIIFMHVLENIGYEIEGGPVCNYIFNHLISHMGAFVALFFLISGFSMCCGYYEKIKNKEISLNDFYKRRYLKILPFFALLVLIDLIVEILEGSIAMGSIYEAFSNLTLMFGFFATQEMTVIGVGWALGVIFGFYILFPFFVFLIWNKKRAWVTFLVLLAINYICGVYFLSNGSPIGANCLRYLCYFAAGGLIYLYRNQIASFYKKMGKCAKAVGILLVIAGLAIVYIPVISSDGNLWVFVGTIQNIIGYSITAIGAMSLTTAVWSNPVSRFISGIGLEIYLSHMLIFRVLEKIGMTHIAGNGILSYILTCAFVIAGALLFSTFYKYIEKKVTKRFSKRKKLNV